MMEGHDLEQCGLSIRMFDDLGKKLGKFDRLDA
jgi:hypothetical protein